MKLLVIPSDVWMNRNNYGIHNAHGVFEPDYKKAFQNDPNLLLAISEINTPLALAEQRFTLLKLDPNYLDRNSTSVKEDDVPEELPLERLARIFKPDIIIQLTYELMSKGPMNICIFNLQALDSSSLKQIAGIEGMSHPSVSGNLSELLKEAVLKNINSFTASIQRYFDILLEKGRECKLCIRIAKLSPINLDSDIINSGDVQRLVEWIDDFFKETLKRFDCEEQESDYSIDFILNIPILDENGREFSFNSYINKFRRYMSDKLKLNMLLYMKGLGEAWMLKK